MVLLMLCTLKVFIWTLFPLQGILVFGLDILFLSVDKENQFCVSE